MLHSLEEFRNYVLDCADGEMGRVYDYLVDDLSWTVRYLVADTRKWLPGRRVLLSPLALRKGDWSRRRLPVALTRDQVKDSPHLDEHAPVSRQHELDLFAHYGWPAYVGNGGAWTLGMLPYAYQRAALADESSEGGDSDDAPERQAPEQRAETELGGKLRSMRELQSYTFALADTEIGHLEDLIADDAWIVRYLVADLRRWLPGGRKVLVAPQWVHDVDWGGSRIALELSEEQLRQCPDYDPHAPVNRVYEQRLYDFHGRPAYWL